MTDLETLQRLIDCVQREIDLINDPVARVVPEIPDHVRRDMEERN